VADAQRRMRVDEAERRATLRRLSMAAERAGHPEVALRALDEARRHASSHERASIAVDRARVLEKLGRYRTALGATTRAIRDCPDPELTNHLVLAQATLRNFQGRWRECLALARRIIDDRTRQPTPRVSAQAHLLAEWCCTALGLPERSEHAEAAFALLTELDDSIGLANLLLNRGESAWRENRPADAIADFRASSERYARAGDVIGAALADNNLGEILTLQFRLSEAQPLLENARRVTLAAGYPHGTLATTSGLARIEAWSGRTDEALRLQHIALTGFTELGADDFVADSLVRLVEIHLLSGDPSSALAAAEQAATSLRRLGDVRVLPATLARLHGRASLALGDAGAARERFERALELATADGMVYEHALAALGMARVDRDEGAAAVALERLAQLGVLAPPPGS
jgi:tetratricopeptide (TPR) repeat protein